MQIMISAHRIIPQFLSSSKFMALNHLIQHRTVQLALAIALMAFQSMVTFGSDQIPGAPQSKSIAIVGATVHTVSGRAIEGGTVVFVAGKITAVGKGVAVPDDAEVIRAEGKHVYPTLIDANTDIGLVEVNSVRATVDSRETGNINPNVRSVAAFNPDSELIPVNRANGVLVALSAPTGGLVQVDLRS